MTNFELKKGLVIYKIEVGKSETISNDKMTDELALKFLKINKSRIELFSKYPENWVELLGEATEETSTEPKPKPAPAKKTTPAKKRGCKSCKKRITKNKTDGSK